MRPNFNNNRAVSAVILAGGKGLRLRTILGPNAQKVMLPLCGKPLIQYTIDELDCSDIHQAVIAVGYHSHDVIEWIDRVQYAFDVC